MVTAPSMRLAEREERCVPPVAWEVHVMSGRGAAIMSGKDPQRGPSCPHFHHLRPQREEVEDVSITAHPVLNQGRRNQRS